jgi:V8-like Glu-specific endopeptidase
MYRFNYSGISQPLLPTAVETSTSFCSKCCSATYILLHIFLSGLHCMLSYLQSHLRSWVANEVEARAKACASTSSCGRGLIGISIVVYLRL